VIIALISGVVKLFGFFPTGKIWKPQYYFFVKLHI
jgi:hypothetical protein